MIKKQVAEIWKLGVGIVFMLMFYSLFLTPIFAQEATDSASSSATLKEKLKALQIDIASKAAQLKTEISNKLQNRVYVGTLESKADDSIRVNVRSDLKNININKFTLYSGKGVTGIKSLGVNDYVAVLGDMDEKEVMSAKKIIRLGVKIEDGKMISFGIVESIEKERITIKLKDGSSQTFDINSKTSIKSGEKEVTFSDIKLTRGVIVVSTGKETKKARFIYLIPSTKVSKINLSITPKVEQL